MKALIIGFFMGCIVMSIATGFIIRDYKQNIINPREYQIDVEMNYYIIYDGNRVVDTLIMPQLDSNMSQFDKAILKDNL